MGRKMSGEICSCIENSNPYTIKILSGIAQNVHWNFLMNILSYIHDKCRCDSRSSHYASYNCQDPVDF